MPKIIDVKDIKLGFWVGAGFALFGALMALLLGLANRARSNPGG